MHNTSLSPHKESLCICEIIRISTLALLHWSNVLTTTYSKKFKGLQWVMANDQSVPVFMQGFVDHLW